jgi:hypothetical protein
MDRKKERKRVGKMVLNCIVGNGEEKRFHDKISVQSSL